MTGEGPMGMGQEPLEAFLRYGQGMLSSVFDSIPVGIIIIDGRGTCLYLNHECTSITGYTLEDARADRRICHGICSGVVEEISAGARSWEGWGRPVIDRQPAIPCKNGGTVSVRLRAASLASDSIIVTIERRAATAQRCVVPAKEDTAAREREVAGQPGSEFRSLAEKSLSLTGVFLAQDGLFRYVNSRFAETFGYAVEELVDRMGPQDLVSLKEWRELEGQIDSESSCGEPTPVQKELRGTTKEGDSIYVELYGSFTTVNGKAAVIGTLLDITKRKGAEERLRKAEEKYRNIFENSVLGIYQTTADGRFLSANSSVARIHGYDSPEELMRTVTDTGEFYASDERRAEFSRIMRQQGFVEGFEAEMRRKDGSINWVSLSTRAVRDEEGNTIYFEGTIQDITERKGLESQLQQSQKMEAIGTLAGGVAHDFNNLLMGIQGYTSLMLLNINQGHEHYEKLKNVEQLVRSGADLTKQLLGFARAGRYQVKVTDVGKVLKNVSAMFMRTKKEITVHEKYEDDLHQIEADQSQIEQAFLNLYVNAWQAMPGGGHLYIDAQNVALDETYLKSDSAQPGEYVKVSVTDTGVGMDEKTMTRIFEPFFTTKEMGRGTGLGLASVYGVVKGHKGVINVYSQVGHGTTFNIYLPASKKARKSPPKLPEELMKGDETILLIDDEEIIINVGKEILETLGYKVITALGGREAIDVYKARQDEVDLVILDMIMPDLEGGKTFDALKEIDPKVSVILSSGYSLNSEAEAIMARGCSAFMQKPFNVYVLSRTIREVIDRATQGKKAGTSRGRHNGTREHVLAEGETAEKTESQSLQEHGSIEEAPQTSR
jgi:two-component system, cell cycle sensor histidine kinase and response regulator CckA